MRQSAYPTFDVFIFDFDGTLADSRHNIANAFNFALADRGLPAVDAQAIYPLIGKLTLADTFTHFYPRLDAATIDNLLHIFRQYQRENVKAELMFFPEALSTLNVLKEKHKRLAIVTTKAVQQLDYILDVFAIRDRFDVVCGLGTLPQHKPDRACVEYVWRCLNIQNGRDQSVMIGDSEVDIATAYNAGIPMIAVSHGVDSLERLVEAGATYTITALSELLRFA